MNSKYLTFTALFLALMLGSVAGTPSQAINVGPRPVSLTGPSTNVPLYDWLRSSMLSIIYGMNDANFTSGDVLYSEFSTHNNGSQMMPLRYQNDSVSFDISSFKTNLDNYLANHPGSPQPLYNLTNEIGSNTSLQVTKNTLLAPTKNVDQLSHFVIFLYDPDKSVINAMNDIRANNSVTSQPFTGDEVITSVRMDRTVESIWGHFANFNTFQYSNGMPAIAFRQFGQFLNEHPFYAHQLISTLNANDLMQGIRNFATPAYDKIIPQNNPIRSVNLGFTVSQLQIDNLTFAKRLNGGLYIKDFGATLVENNALGVTVFNDTNSNGIMDMAMKTINSDRPGFNGTVLPTGSSEAMYRVDFLHAQSHTYTPVSKTSGQDELTFAFDAQNVAVHLNPVNQNQDSALVSPDSAINESIDSFGYKFHFTTNSTSKAVNVKFDYNLGTWSNQTALAGLSLNQMFLTGVKDFSAHQRVMKLDNNNQDVNDSAQSGTARRFAIKAGQAQVASIDLDQIPYTLNGNTQKQAYGQTLPLLYTQFLFGSLTVNNNVIRTLGGDVSSQRYLYSLSYPVFNGQSISHDPTFSMVSASSSTSSSSGSTSGSSSTTVSGAPGFELLSVLAVPIIIVLRKRK